MKNVKSAHFVRAHKFSNEASFLQIDNRPSQLKAVGGVVILPSPEAYDKFGWARRHFRRRPGEGYFIWVKERPARPLVTCVAISSKGVSQSLNNLVVIEEGVEAEMRAACCAVGEGLGGKHVGHTEFILRENAGLKINLLHRWGRSDKVSLNSRFTLGEGAELSHHFRSLEPSGILEMRNEASLGSLASASFEIAVLAKESEVKMSDSVYLVGDGSCATMRLKTVADRSSKIKSWSKMVAEAAGVGHLDCMGLLLDEDSIIGVVPELLNKNKSAQLTHEASVGRISEEALNYLRSRGLTADEAIDLIVTGILGEEEPFALGGQVLESKLYM